MPDVKPLLVPILLAGQAVLALWAGSGETRPEPPALSSLPTSFAGWTRTAEIPVDAVASQLGAARAMEWLYSEPASQWSADLFVAWFQSQRSGAVQPHSPLICLPGNGWALDSKRTVTLDTAAGSLPGTLVMASKAGQSAVVLFWYQTAFRAAAGEWESKLWLAVDIFRQKRTDIALVRVVVAGGNQETATATARRFATDAYPRLREWLPR